MTVAVTSLMPTPLDPVSAEVAIGTPTGGPVSESGFAMLVAALNDGAPASDLANSVSSMNVDAASTSIVATTTANEMPPMSAVSQLQWLTQLQASDLGIFAQPKAQPSPLPQSDQSFDPAAANVPEGDAPDSPPVTVTISDVAPPTVPQIITVATIPEQVEPVEESVQPPEPQTADQVNATATAIAEPGAPADELDHPAEARTEPQQTTETAIAEPSENASQPQAPRTASSVASIPTMPRPPEADQLSDQPVPSGTSHPSAATPAMPRILTSDGPVPEPSQTFVTPPAMNSAVVAQILAIPDTYETASAPPETTDSATPKSQTRDAKPQAQAAAPAIAADDAISLEPAPTTSTKSPETADSAKPKSQTQDAEPQAQAAAPAIAADDAISLEPAPTTSTNTSKEIPQDKRAQPKVKLASDTAAQPVKAQGKAPENPDVLAAVLPEVPPPASAPQAIAVPQAVASPSPKTDDTASDTDENSRQAVQASPVQTIPVIDAEQVAPAKSSGAVSPKSPRSENDAPSIAQQPAPADQTSPLVATAPASAPVLKTSLVQVLNGDGLDAPESALLPISASAAKPNWAPADLVPSLKGDPGQPAAAQDATKPSTQAPLADAANTQGANTAPAGTQPANAGQPNTTAPITRATPAENQPEPQNVNVAPAADPQQPAQHASGHLPAPQHFADVQAPASAPLPTTAVSADTAPVPNGISFNPPSPTEAPIRIALTSGPNGAATADMEALALKIAARSADGDSNFQIRLDPPELGRIDVVLNVDSHGKAAAELSADSPQTLELLQRDAPALERALKDSGIDLSSMSFSLKSDAQASQDRDARSSARDRAVRIGAVDAAAASAAMVGNAGLSGQNYGAGTMRLDITV